MPLNIASENPLSTDGRALIDGSEATLRALYAEDECFSLGASELANPNVAFFVARMESEPVGCIALCECDGYAEIKRLFVLPTARGTGAGRKLILHLENAAAGAGHRLIRLESGHKLVAAVALYQKLGYVERGPFGDYDNHPASLFMEKCL